MADTASGSGPSAGTAKRDHSMVLTHTKDLECSLSLVQLLRTMLSAHRVCWCSAWWVSVQPDILLLPGVALWE